MKTKSTTAFPTGYRWSVYVTSESPKECFKKWKFNRIKSATKFRCAKTFSGKVVEESDSYELAKKYRMESVSFHLKYWLKLICPVVASMCMLPGCHNSAAEWRHTVHHLVLLQSMHVTDRWTDRQNCNSNTVHYIACSRTVKQIQNRLFSAKEDGRRHRYSTLQLHGLFALAKHLFINQHSAGNCAFFVAQCCVDFADKGSCVDVNFIWALSTRTMLLPTAVYSECIKCS